MKYSLFALVLSLFLVSCDSTEPPAVAEESVTFSSDADSQTDDALAAKAVCPCYVDVDALAAIIGPHTPQCFDDRKGRGGFVTYVRQGDNDDDMVIARALKASTTANCGTWSGSSLDVIVITASVARSCNGILRKYVRENSLPDCLL